MRWMRGRFGLSGVDVAVLAIALLAAGWVAMSMRTDAVARRRTLELADFLREVHRCQVEHHRRHDRYASALSDLDLRLPMPTAFDLRPMRTTDDGWTLTAVAVGTSPPHRPTISIDHHGWFDRPRQGSSRSLTTRSTLAMANEVTP